MNKKQKILAILTLGLILFLLFSNVSKAQTESNPFDIAGQTIGWIGDKAIGGVLWFVGLLLDGLAATITIIAGWLVDFAVSLNFEVLQNPIVSFGWQISRDIANLGFVLFIIIIAIATILRIQQYGAKSALGKLIAVALLVNFSLFFAGVIINFSNMLTNFFVSNVASGSLSNLSGVIFNATNMHSLTQVSSSTVQAYSTGGLINHSISMILIAGLTMIAAFIMFAFAIMFLIRFIALSFLLILAPLACLFWILPVTQKIWGNWWNEFTKWILFAPAASFFLYLGIYLMTNYGNWINRFSQSAQGTGTAASIAQPTLIANLFSKVANLIITGGFMLGGLIAANSFGLQGVKVATSLAQNARKWIQGTVAAGGAQRAFMSGVKRDTTTGEITTRGQRIATAVSRVPGFRGVAQRISAFSSPQAKAEEVEKYRKDNLTSLTNEALIRQMTTPGVFTNRTAAAAMIQDAARRNLTGDARITPILNKYLQTAQGMGNINTVLNNRPDLAPIAAGAKTTKETEEAIKKVMSKIRADKADEISHDALGQLDVVLGLSTAHLERLARVGEPRQREAIDKIIKANFSSQLTSIKKYRADVDKIKQSIADAAAKNDKDLAEKLIKQRDGLIAQEKTLVSSLNAKDKKILEHDTFISQNPNWQV